MQEAAHPKHAVFTTRAGFPEGLRHAARSRRTSTCKPAAPGVPLAAGRLPLTDPKSTPRA